MKSQRRSKSLELLARSIKDSDQFVTHVCNVAAAYGRHPALDPSATRDVRQALRSFAKHAEALSDWLKSAARTGSPTVEGQALRQIGLASGNPAAIGQTMGMRAWLAQVAQAGTTAADAAAGQSRQEALRSAAEGLRATFEHHGIKLSQRAPEQKQSDAVRLLCAMAEQGGSSLEAAEARQLLQARRVPATEEEDKPTKAARREQKSESKSGRGATRGATAREASGRRRR